MTFKYTCACFSVAWKPLLQFIVCMKLRGSWTLGGHGTGGTGRPYRRFSRKVAHRSIFCVAVRSLYFKSVALVFWKLPHRGDSSSWLRILKNSCCFWNPFEWWSPLSLAWKSAFSRTHILRNLDRSGVQEPHSPFQGKEEPRSARTAKVPAFGFCADTPGFPCWETGEDRCSGLTGIDGSSVFTISHQPFDLEECHVA